MRESGHRDTHGPDRSVSSPFTSVASFEIAQCHARNPTAQLQELPRHIVCHSMRPPAIFLVLPRVHRTPGAAPYSAPSCAPVRHSACRGCCEALDTRSTAWCRAASKSHVELLTHHRNLFLSPAQLRRWRVLHSLTCPNITHQRLLPCWWLTVQHPHNRVAALQRYAPKIHTCPSPIPPPPACL